VSLWLVSSAAAAEPTYWQEVRPVLRKHCTVCHNEKRVGEVDISGGLALDTYEAVAKRPKRAVIQAGKSAESKLVKLLLVSDENKRMPQGAPALPEESIALIRRWIDSGAKEGMKPASVETIETKTETVRTRKLDVILPTNAIPPAGVLGPDKPAKLELALKIGPLSPVAAVTFSQDGKLLAVGSYGLVTIWDLEKGQPAKTLTSVLGAVNCLRFSPDGQTLAVAGGQPSAKGEVRLFKVADWSLIAALPGHTDVVSCLAFTADGKQLATASFDKTVRVWDTTTHKLQKTLTGHSDFVYSVAFSPDGQWLVSASKDRTVKMVETATGKSLLTFSGMDQDVLTVAVSPDGKQIVSSGLESQLFWWNPKTGERVRRQNGHGVAVHEVCFSKDGKRVASAGADRTVRLWASDTGNVQQTINVGSIAYAVALTPDGQRVAAAGADGLVRLYDTTGRHLLTFLSLPPTGEQHDWLAIAPEGYANGSDSLVGLGQWRMAGKGVGAEPVWKTLRQAEAIGKANRGEPLAPPTFSK
jgi:DNA-binding beta-propeller fold protein YncE